MPSIITNGDHAAETLRKAFLGVSVLPWRDVLVDGPVRALPDDAFCDDRARHLAYAFGHPYDDVRADFTARQRTLERMATSDAIELWFETDLHDQLQVLDILVRLGEHDELPPISLIQADPPLPQHDLVDLAVRRAEVTADEFAAARTMWQALTRPAPDAMVREAFCDGPLPVTRAALQRFLQELPAPGDGLSRIERETLRTLAAGADTPATAFRRYTTSEELPFLGDAGFFSRLMALDFSFGLIVGLPRRVFWNPATRTYDRAFLDAPIDLTPRGRAVLAGDHDLVADQRLDRWVAGTHLRPGAIWRWDTERAALTGPD